MYNSIVLYFLLTTGKFGVVYRGLYTTKENNIIEVAVKTVKCKEQILDGYH